MNDGTYKSKITKVEPIHPRFEDQSDGFELKISLEFENKEIGTTYLEFSSRFGVGNSASKTRWQLSLETLQSIGWTNGEDFSNIESLEGKIIQIKSKTTVKNGTSYTNYYISTYENKPMSKTDISERMAQLKGASKPQAWGAPPQANPPPSAQVASDPFG